MRSELLPPGWRKLAIGKVADLRWGDTNTTKASYVEKGFPAYSASGRDGYLAHADFDITGVVLSAIGADCGRTWLAKGQWSCIKNTIRFWSIDPEVKTEYLYWATRGQRFWPRRGSAQPFISQTDARNVEVVLPPLPIQEAIVNTLGLLEHRIELLRQTNATLEAIAQALFKSWFVDFDPVRAKAEGREPEGMDAATAALFPSEFEDSELGPVPKGWQVMPLLDACDLQGGSQPPASTFINEPRDGYVRLLQIRDFSTDAHPTYIPVSKKLKTAQEDDILIGRYGSASGDKQKDSLGRICRGLEGAYNVALMKLSPAAVGREFALQLFNDQNFYNYLQGVSTKAVQSGFSKKELALYKVVVPSSNLLAHYESLGVAVWQRVKMARQQIAALTALRDTLLPRLISGKLRLPEAEREIEAATA